MKKVYLLFVASIAMIASAFAEPISIDPAGQYQMKITVEAEVSGNVYAKAFGGNDNAFIEIDGPDDAGEGVKLTSFAAGTTPIEGSLMTPYGSLSAIDRILFTFPWTNAGNVTVKEIQILDADGKDLMEGATLTSIENTHIAEGVSATCSLTDEGDGFSINMSGMPQYGWGAQFMLWIDASGQSSAVDETAAPVISAVNGTVYCDTDFVIYNMIGVDVTAQNGSLKGNYIVVAGDQVSKVNVR